MVFAVSVQVGRWSLPGSAVSAGRVRPGGSGCASGDLADEVPVVLGVGGQVEDGCVLARVGAVSYLSRMRCWC